MSLKFLIDECLSLELVRIANATGHHGSTCVRDRGLSGIKDHNPVRFAVEHDFTLVTCNSVDFRGASATDPGGEYARQPLHAGLICLNAAGPLHLELQLELFTIALDVIANEALPLLNQVFELSQLADSSFEWVAYELPRGGLV